jgi:hypothetical protein
VSATAIIPVPRSAIAIRAATSADVGFIDGLQKLHGKMVGWFPTKQIEGKINAGHVLIAVGARPASPSEGDAGVAPTGERLGYVIAQDRYMGRDEVGVIFQLNVAPTNQRSLIGATLIKSVFDRAAYGCKLFCLWCAQDIDANYFWESIGFIPIAFRTGSRAKGKGGQPRTHIFWQRRIREGDTTTPFWFPSQTKSGAIREDRLVIPIPPNTHWKDAMPVLLPPEPAQLEDASGRARGPAKPKVKRKPGIVRLSSVFFAPPAPPVAERPKPAKRPKVKNDPAHVAAARELRDRYLEQFNSGTVLLTGGKYDVSRMLPQTMSIAKALPAAA